MPQNAEHTATFRFYEELNDFLPREQRKRDIKYHFQDFPGIKDAIEAQGVPHTEVELILVNGESVGFDYQLKPGDRVSVYPMFESLDVSHAVKLREHPLRDIKFIADVHLGKLARTLRLLGFDTVYRNDLDDPEIVQRAVDEHRIILTCDRGILKHSAVTHGYCLRSRDPNKQIYDVIRRFDLQDQLEPFTRCIRCNGRIYPVDKKEVIDKLPPRVAQTYDEFNQCERCGNIYWKGSHYARILERIKAIKKEHKA